MCKFYQGAEDKSLELKLKSLFAKVHREKPESSRKVRLEAVLIQLSTLTSHRKESKESFFVALRRKPDAKREDVLGDG